ncbi:MAG: dihydrofolate reductase family protein [Anaerolineae bacterium]|nr:dihydrofolate reductase family protein [Anaerolineae bacterium]
MNRPRLIVHQSASLDGRLTLAPDVLLLWGDARWTAISQGGSDAYAAVKAQYRPGALLEGSGSFVLEGQDSEPLPPAGDTAVLYEDHLPEEIVRRDGHVGWMTVVDGRGRVRWLYKEYPDPAWAGWYLLVLVHRQTPPEYLAYLRRELIPYLVAGSGPHVDLGAGLVKLRERLDVTTVVSTAGGRLNGALLRAGLVDEVSVEFLPGLIGGFTTPSLFDSPSLGPEEAPTRLRLLAPPQAQGDTVWLRYAVVRE